VTWRPVEADEAMAERIKSAMQTIYRHLGAEAPEPSTTVSPQFNDRGDLQYITPTEVFTLAGALR
jgi:hypothetical protein